MMYCCRFLIFSSLVVLLSGCSVKEDREFCPAPLVMDWSELKGEYGAGIVCWGVEGCVSDTVEVSDLPYESVVMVPHDRPGKVYVFYDRAKVPSRTVSSGEEFGELFSYYSIDSGSDRDTVRLLRNHARLIVRMEGIFSPALSYEIAGHFIGYGFEGELEEGQFRCPLIPRSGVVSTSVIPRQGDSSLRLDVYSSEKLERSFPVGKYIIESGYDWNEDSLKDIYLEVDVVSSVVKFRIGLWTKTVNIKLTV